MGIESGPEHDPVSMYRLEHRIRSLEAKLRVLSGAALAFAVLIGVVSITGASPGTQAPEMLSAGQFHLVHDGSIVGRWVSGTGGTVRFEALGNDGSVVSAVEILPETPFARADHSEAEALDLRHVAGTAVKPRFASETKERHAFRRLD